MKKILRTFVLILTVTLLFSCGRAEKKQDPVDHYVEPATEPPTSVTAEPQTIQIFTADDFFAIDPNSTKKYIVMNDIDFSGRFEGLKTFRGTLEGNGHSFLNVQKGNLVLENYGTIRNLSIYCAIKKTDQRKVGGLICTNHGVIDHCTTYGSITIKGTLVRDEETQLHFELFEPKYGGICAETMRDGGVQYCANFANITLNIQILNPLGNPIGATSYLGGICGYSLSGSPIHRCSNYGTICDKKSSFTGGICGYGGNVNNCSNYGMICSTGKHGGICGMHSGRFMELCINYGTIDGGEYVWNKNSAICGWNCGSYIKNCYFLSSSAVCGVGMNDSNTTKIVALSEEQMKEQSSFPALDFENDWIMTETGPQLRFELELQANDQNMTTP